MPVRSLTKDSPRPPANAARAVVSFWREAGKELWFAKDPAFDRLFRETFLADHERTARGECDGWLGTPEDALALILLLDQYPRNAFRGEPRMYATDAAARQAAKRAVEAGHDHAVDIDLRTFIYLPFAHSEDLDDQNVSVALCRDLPPPGPTNAQRHRDIIARFGRFPHRNPILGRQTTAAEQAFLDNGGYAG